MTRFETIIVAIISVSMVTGFIITGQSSHPQPQAQQEPSQTKPASSTPAITIVHTSPGNTSTIPPKPPKKIPLNKQNFYNSLLPFIEEENKRLAGLRKDLNQIQSTYQSGDDLSVADNDLLSRLARKYRVSNDISVDTIPSMLKELLVKVDQIPASLVLAQSANESAWGRSRFATEGNNYFGVWCFKPGCGIVPNGRPENAKYEVTKYHSTQDSVNAYFLNINRHPAYKNLRQIRADLRANNEPVTGAKLAAGLDKYSTRGEAYIKELRAMIRYNKLEGITAQQL
ncbi:MAG: glucosaminidase domain-containing protein [Pseudomonadales bacterium]|nr:glucosaminidase domain-containing protein [Pseudomonadales bacterium]